MYFLEFIVCWCGRAFHAHVSVCVSVQHRLVVPQQWNKRNYH